MTMTAVSVLGDSAFCMTCGMPFLLADGPSCGCPPSCSCAAELRAIRKQIDALDRGLLEADKTASRALAAAESLERHQATQDQVWTDWRAGRAEAEAAEAEGAAIPRPRSSRPSVPASEHASRAARIAEIGMAAVPAGGAA